MNRIRLRFKQVRLPLALAALSAVAWLAVPQGGTIGWVGSAMAQTAPGPQAGQWVVIKLHTGRYYHARVDRRYTDNGFDMLAYSWTDRNRYGSGELPLSLLGSEIFSVADARARGFRIVNAESASAAPARPQPAAPRPEPPQAAPPAPPATTAAPGNAANALNAAEQAQMVAAHNQWRQDVGVPGLRWSGELANIAQGWAQHLKQTRNCQIDATAHSKRSGIGENLSAAGPITYSDGRRERQPVSPADVTQGWGEENKDYDHASNSCRGVCGHYTQVVWKATQQLGCARAVCQDNSQVWVCNYAPAGNYRGQRPY